MTRSALQITADSLSAALAKMLNGPHSAHRRAEEALERMTKECPKCGGFGRVGIYNEPCFRCDGTGEIVTDEPDEDASVPEPVTADDWFWEEDNDRYHADLEAAE